MFLIDRPSLHLKNFGQIKKTTYFCIEIPLYVEKIDGAISSTTQ